MRELPALDCSLDATGLVAQRARYEALAPHVRATKRGDSTLVVDFDARVDRGLLAEALAIERECCPFFALRLDGDRLTAGVDRPEHEPALAAIEYALGGDRR